MPTVHVKWNGAVHGVALPADATVGALRAELERLTGVPRSGQKLAGTLALTKAEDPAALFGVVKDGQKLMMIGTADRPVQRPAKPSPAPEPPSATPAPVYAARHLTAQSPMLAERFQNAAKAKVLSLDHLVIKTLSDDVFARVPDLSSLDVSHNVLLAVCPGIPALALLRRLNVSHNQLDSIDCLAALSGLEVLDASHNLIGSVAEGTLGPRLREVDLSANRLAALSDGLFDPPAAALRVLNLSGNHLTALPASVFRLSGLQDLDVDRNCLESFGTVDTVTGLRQLKRLSLQHNRIAVLPDELFAESDLMELNLTGNPVNWDQVQHMPSYEKWVARFEQSIKKKYCLH
eukprot:EG_transcript_14557